MRAPILPRRQPQHLLTEKRSASPSSSRGKWSTLVGLVAVVAGLLGGLAVGLGTGCVIADPEYCDSNVKCASQSGDTQMVCNMLRHTCVAAMPNGCSENTDCKDPTLPRCDKLSMACTPCRTDDAMSCSSVSTSARCTELEGGETRCVECGRNADCKDAARPICDLGTNQCRGCQRHSDCEGELLCDTGAPCTNSLVCIKEGDLAQTGLGGRCALNGTGPEGKVIYMSSPDPKDMNGVVLCGQMNARDGRTPEATPLCSITEALKKAKNANIRYIRIIGDWDFDVPSLTLTKEGPYHLIGAPRAGKTQNRALIAKSTFLEMLKGVSVTLDQVDLVALFPDINLLFCDGRGTTSMDASTLRILGSTLTGTSLPSTPLPFPGAGAIAVADCNLLIDRSVIGVTKMADLTNPNAGAHSVGIRYWRDTVTHPRTVTIQNSLFAGNIQFAIHFDGTYNDSAKLRFQFNTIVGNGRRSTTAAGAVYCPFDPPLGPNGAQFLNNIIINNSRDAAMTQFIDPLAAGCSFHNTVVGPIESSSRPGLIKGDVKLGDDLRTIVGAGSDTNVIDKALPYMNPAGMTEAVPAYDLDGNKRPAGAAADVGATEVKK